MDGLTPEEKQRALTYLKNGADFAFEPSQELCNMLIADSDTTEGINDVLTAILLERKPIRLDPNTVEKYCKGTLDKNNTWLFNHGNIRAVAPRYKKEVKLRSEEDEALREKPQIIEGENGKLVIEKKEENKDE